MGNKIAFSEEGFRDYLYWQSQDRKTLEKINRLILDIQRNGAAQGIGKPEPLRYRDGWSRRIDAGNRLLYQMMEEVILITSCRGHYDDK